MKKNIFITLQYDGTRYSGWQRQGNTDNTIENKLSLVLQMMLESNEMIEIHGSGRTDAGVHAMGQTANFHIDTDKNAYEILTYLNKYLPEDIKIISAKEVDLRFHARLLATGKKYIYVIDNSIKADVFTRKFSTYISEKLDIDKMRQAADVFVGKHDFINFCDMKNKKKSSVRIINSINILCENDIISIEFDGNGFLYHMVRRITAALIEVGLHRLDVDDLNGFLDGSNNKRFDTLAPAKGLVLKEVRYN